MKVKEEKVGTVDVIVPGGPLVDEDSQEFIDIVEKHLQASNPRLVLNLKDVAYIDSHGLEVLLSVVQELRGRRFLRDDRIITPQTGDEGTQIGEAKKTMEDAMHALASSVQS